MDLDPATCLLEIVTNQKGRKVEWKFMQVALLLANRWVAISWIIPSGPREQGWMKDVKEWAVAEEMHLRQCRRDEHAPEDLQTLGLLLTRVEEVPEDEIQESEG